MLSYRILSKILLVCFLTAIAENIKAYQIDGDEIITTVVLEKSLEIKSLDDINPDLIFGNLLALEIDKYNSIYVLDYKERAVLKFNKSGRFINKIGRSGKGPGEFLNPLSMTILQDSLIAVLDVDLLRISVLSIDDYDSHPAQTHNLNLKSAFKGLNSRPLEVYYSNTDNQFLLQYIVPYSPGTSQDKRERSVYAFDGKNTRQKPVLIIPENEAMIEDSRGMISVGPLPFGGKSKIMIQGDTIYHGWTKTPAINISNTDGEFLNEITFENPAVNITKNDIESLYLNEFQKRNINQLPKTFPAFDWFVVDEQTRVWIAANTEDRVNYHILIFDNNGTQIGESLIEKSIELLVIKNGFAYGFETDKYDEKSVVRYKIHGIED